MNITIALIKEALDHCSDKQEQALIGYLNGDLESWAGIELGQILADHVESMTDDTGPTQTELDEEAAEKRGA